MSADDDWVVKLRFDTSDITKAMEKIQALKTTMSNLYGKKETKAKAEHTSVAALEAKKQKTDAAAQKKLAASKEAERRKELAHNKRVLDAATKAEDKRAAATVAANKKIEANKEKARRNQELRDKRDENNRKRALSDSVRAANHNERLRSNYMNGAEREAHRVNNSIERAKKKAIRDRERGFSGSVSAAAHNARLRSNYMNGAEAEAHRMNNNLDRARRRSEREARTDYNDDHTIALRLNRERNSRRTGAEAEAHRMNNNRDRMETGRGGLRNTSEHYSRRIVNEGLSGRDRAGFNSRLTSINANIAGATNQTQLAAARNEMRALNREINNAVRSQRALTAEQQRGNFAVRSMSSSMSNMARSYLSVFAVAGAGKGIFDNAKEMENLSVATLMAAGSAGAADEAFQKILNTSRETGLSLGSMTDMYNKIVISAKDAKIGVAETDEIFKGVTTLSIGYGFDKVQQKLVGKAFAQMMGKQQVMAEEFDFRLAS